MECDGLVGRVILLVEEGQPTTGGLAGHLEQMGARVFRTQLTAAGDFLRERLSAVVMDGLPVTGQRRAFLRELRRVAVPVLFHGADPPTYASSERHAVFVAGPCPANKLVAAVRHLLLSENRRC